MGTNGASRAKVMSNESATKAGAFRSCFFQRRAHGRWARNFPLYHPANNLSREKLHKKQRIFFPEFVHSALLTFGVGCGIIIMSRGNANCGANVAPDRRSSTDNNRAEKVEKISISLLTSHPNCDTIRVSRGDGNHFRFAVVQVNEIEKKCKKPLDKSPNLCYNKGTKGEGRSQKASPTRDE